MSDVITCNYEYEIIDQTAFFHRTKTLQEIKDFELVSQNFDSMVIDDIMVADLPFIKYLAQIFNKKYCINFGIMGNYVDTEVVNKLPELFLDWMLIFSLNLALSQPLPDNLRVGTLVKNDGILYPQAINGSLNYGHFKKIFPYVDKIVSDIEALNLTTLQKIIYIDNWFQANVQYLKEKETKDAEGNIYYCEQINELASVPDVLINHYGVCEDIATSIVAILTKLKINSEEIQANAHAWVAVEIDGKNYVWDCTRNITRNPHRTKNGIKATEYSCKFTLVGLKFDYHTYGEGRYNFPVEQFNYSQDFLLEQIEYLKKQGINFKYDLYAPYDSYIKNV